MTPPCCILPSNCNNKLVSAYFANQPQPFGEEVLDMLAWIRGVTDCRARAALSRCCEQRVSYKLFQLVTSCFDSMLLAAISQTKVIMKVNL